MQESEQQQLEKLVNKYELNKKLYERQSYNETELRVEFLNPLFKLLGWDVDNEQGRPSYSRDVGRILRTFKIKKNVEVTDNGKDDF